MPALSVPSGTRSRRALRGLAAATALAVVPALGVANTATAQQGHRSTISQSSHDRQLAPRTHFTMQADGSSGLTAGGEGIPNIDSVKKTIATYYGDPGTRHRGQDVVALHRRDDCHPAGPEDLPQDGLQPRRQAGREARAGLRRGRHHAVDVRHGGRGRCTSTSTRPCRTSGSRSSASRRHRAWSSFVNTAAATGVHRLRSHRPQRRPEGRHRGQPGQGRVHRLRRRPLLHEVDRRRGPLSSRHTSRALRRSARPSSTRPAPASTSRTSATTSCSTSATSGPTCRVGTPTAS